MSTENLKCRISKRDITLDDIKFIVEHQGNTHTINDRGGDKDAFEVALEGSKVYLKHKGLLDYEED